MYIITNAPDERVLFCKIHSRKKNIILSHPIELFFTLSHPIKLYLMFLTCSGTARSSCRLHQLQRFCRNAEFDVALKWVLQLQSNLTSDLLLLSFPLGPFPSHFVLPGEQGQWVILHLQYIGIAVLHLFWYMWTLVTSSIGTPFKLITGKSRRDSGGCVEHSVTQCVNNF